MQSTSQQPKVHIWVDDVRLPGTPVLSIYNSPIYQHINWWWVKTVPEFKAAIAKVGMENVGLLALDHDLGICDDCIEHPRLSNLIEAGEAGHVTHYFSCVHNGDGTELVQWMEAENMWPEQKPTVHSYNPDGARRMRAIIDKHYEQ